MSPVFAWPHRLPPGLEGLFEAVESRLPDEVRLDEIADLACLPADPGTAGGSLLVVVDGAVAGETPSRGDLDVVTSILQADTVDVVLVVGDSYLGSDAADLAPAQTAAAAVAAVRSKATRRGASRRANAVCIPSALLGSPSSQRAPLAHTTEMADVADAAAFLLDDDNTYLNGQVLFVNGGRHLFSSLSA